MTTSVSLSTRVSPELRERLLGQARARHVSLGVLARDLLAAGVDGGEPAGGVGPIQNEVACIFHDLPPEAGVHREVCMALAKTVESGGGGQVAAANRLLELTRWARHYFEPEVNLDDELASLDGLPDS
jgi:hypothetical protein